MLLMSTKGRDSSAESSSDMSKADAEADADGSLDVVEEEEEAGGRSHVPVFVPPIALI